MRARRARPTSTKKANRSGACRWKIPNARAPTSGASTPASSRSWNSFGSDCWPRARSSRRRPGVVRRRVIHLLYNRYYPKFRGSAARRERKRGRAGLLSRFPRRLEPFLSGRSSRFPASYEPVHTFACYRQIQRAFEHIFHAIIGGFAARRTAARRGVAIHLHSRHAPLSAHAVCAHGRFRHADHRPIRHRQGTGRAGHRAIALRSLR